MKTVANNKIIMCCISILLLSGPALAATWQVPADAPTIQAGIDLASPGDIVLVACGDYFENNINMSNGVTLKGASSTEGCVTLHGNGEAGIWFSDFNHGTVQNLSFVECGESALRLLHASPLIEDCHFEGNSFTDGGAIHMLGSNPTIRNCTFLNNSASHAGGAIAMGDCWPTIVGCTFSGNVANLGGAIDVESYSSLVLTDCILENNVANFKGGALVVWQNLGPSSITVFSSTIMNNQAPAGADGWADGGCYLTVMDSALTPDFLTTFDGPGTIFIDSVVAVERKSWGEVKAFYR